MALAQSESQGEAFYQHLPADSIRVLQLKGTSLVSESTGLPSDLAIDCDVKVIRLSDQRREQYSALSYVWGSPRFPRWLRCDHVLIKITPNLYDALWHLIFSGKGPGFLWVDAVCINQTDNEEKSQQVSMMAQIYQEATDVVVWLGIIPQNNIAAETFWDGLASQFQHNETTDEFDKMPDKVTILKALEILARNEWFYRVWTLQEIALAREAYVWCGHFRVDWQRFASVAEFLRTMPSSSATSRLLDVLKGIEICSSLSEHASLYRLIETAKGREATDARDKVFGLLGLWKNRSRLTPNYDETIVTTHARAIFEIWKAERWLWLNLRNIPPLSDAGSRLEEPVTLQKILHVPPYTSPTSWIPSLDDINATIPPRAEETYLTGSSHRSYADTWNYQGPSVPEIRFDCLNPNYHAEFQLSGTTLQAKGVILGTWSRYNAPGRARWQYNGASGVFEGFPQCVVLPDNIGVNVNEPCGPSCFTDASRIYQLMRKHIDTSCTCADRWTVSSVDGDKIYSKRQTIREQASHTELHARLDHTTNSCNASHDDKFAWLCLIFGKSIPLVLQPHYNEKDGTVQFCILNQLKQHHYWSIAINFSGWCPEAQNSATWESNPWKDWVHMRTNGGRNMPIHWYHSLEVDEDGNNPEGIEEVYDRIPRVLSLALREEEYEGQTRPYERGPGEYCADTAFPRECHLNWIPTKLSILGDIPEQMTKDFKENFVEELSSETYYWSK